MKGEKIERISRILIPIFSLITIIIAIITYQLNAKKEAESKALILYNDYLKLSIQLAEIKTQPVDSFDLAEIETMKNYINFSFTTAESIFNQVGEKAVWQSTIIDIFCDNFELFHHFEIMPHAIDEDFSLFLEHNISISKNCLKTLNK